MVINFKKIEYKRIDVESTNKNKKTKNNLKKQFKKIIKKKWQK